MNTNTLDLVAKAADAFAFWLVIAQRHRMFSRRKERGRWNRESHTYRTAWLYTLEYRDNLRSLLAHAPHGLRAAIGGRLAVALAEERRVARYVA